MGGHPTRHQLIRAARYAAYGAAALLVLVVAAALAVPLFLDTPAVERELQAKLSQLVQGEMAWEKLSIRLLPSPRGSLAKFKLEIPGVVSVRAEQVDAHLRLVPLFHGRAEIAAVSLEKPSVRIRISSAGPGKKEQTAGDPVEAYRSIVRGIGELIPEALLEVENGEIEIDVEGAGLVRVGGLHLGVEARAEDGAQFAAGVDVRAGPVEILRGTERVRVPRVSLRGNAAAGVKEIAADIASAELGASRLSGARVRYGLEEGALASSTGFDLDLAQTMDAVRRLIPDEASKALAGIQPAGRAQGQAKFDLRGSTWNARIDITKSDSSVAIEGLPGPVKITSGSVNVSRDATGIERANVAMLDSRALASATIAYGKGLRIEGSVPEASVGEDLLTWAWKTGGAPPNVRLKTPMRVAVQRAAWSPKKPLDLAATASFDSGPDVSAELGWTPQVLDIRRASVKDAKSDATFSLHLEKGLAEGRFSGSLQGATIGAALKDAKVPSGGVNGDLRLRVDLAHPGQGTATGKLKGNALDLTWLLGRPLVVERVHVEADGQKLVIREASVNWAEQRFALSGTLARAADGAPIVDAQLTSPGVMVDALLPPKEARQAEPPAKKGGADDALWTQWPLPARGRIELHAGFVQYGERKAEPVLATLKLEPERASLEIKEARLCGISFPLTAEARPKGRLAVNVKLTASKQQIEQTARCLTERGVQMTGEFRLSADLRASGTYRDLLSNLQGAVEAESLNGRVRQFPLIFKILSLRDVAESLKKDGVSLEDAGFPYLGITAKGRFDNGTFVVDESSFRSNSVGFAASGSILLSGDPPKPYDTKLTILVAPLSRLDTLVRDIPLLGDVIGGTLTSWPVRATEDIRDPKVELVSPEAIGLEFIGMFQRALKLPTKLLPKFGG